MHPPDKVVPYYDPSTGAAYANNFINPTAFNTPALNLLKLLPVSTDPCGKITYAIPNPNNENQYVCRLGTEPKEFDLRSLFYR
jgi:hypothetical protein